MNNVSKRGTFLVILLAMVVCFSACAIMAEDAADDVKQRMYVFCPEPSEEAVLARMKDTDPEAYKMYIWAKYDDPYDPLEEYRKLVVEAQQAGRSIDDIEWEYPIDDEILQRGIELKRSLYSVMTAETAKELIGKYIDSDEIVYISKYSGMVIAELTSGQLSKILENEPLLSFEPCPDFENGE